MRQLATIKRISNILPIQNKDRIELAVIDGWQVIVKKDEYRIGDLAVFCEIDSVFPDKPEFEFLRKYKFRIKTLKMAGVLSQGICFPLSVLPNNKVYEIDNDVTALMEITQYCNEKEVSESRENAQKLRNPFIKWLFRFKIFRKILSPKIEYKDFPAFIPKTNESYIQNNPSVLSDRNIEYVVREKLDGQSGTFFLQKIKPKWPWQKFYYEFGVCSRNLRSFKKSDRYWIIAKKYGIERALRGLIEKDQRWIAIQGECIGPKIQNNKYKLSSLDFYAFNLISANGKVNCLHAESLLSHYGIKWAPLIESNYKQINDINQLLDFSTGISLLAPVFREGIILRNYEKNISFKVISPDWLIKHDM